MCVERHLLEVFDDGHVGSCPPTAGPIKWIETRGYPAPAKHSGVYVGIHAAKRPVDDGLTLGDYTTRVVDGRDVLDWASHDGLSGAEIDLHRGHLVGTARLVGSVPMVDGWSYQATDDDEQFVMLFDPPHDGDAVSYRQAWGEYHDIADQLPYGHFAVGRHAWILVDAKPVRDRCPACLGTGSWPRFTRQVCPQCQGRRTCDPILMSGKQGWWYWAPPIRRLEGAPT